MLDEKPRLDSTCPKCGGLIYSHRSRMCGTCGAVLPPEVVLTDDKAKAREEERAWARKIADACLPGPGTRAHSTIETGFGVSPADTPEGELLPPRNFEYEFRHREKPHGYIVFLGPTITLGLLYTFSQWFGGFNSTVWAFTTIGFGFSCWISWLSYWPICPNCHANIRNCPLDHCYICGKPMRKKRCSDCDADFSWRAPFISNGSKAWNCIAHCPGCGVELNTWFRRWNRD